MFLFFHYTATTEIYTLTHSFPTRRSSDLYCCFESKLTRILQEQGRPQINKPWGKPKEEQCAGFTIDEFSRLDMSQMDFSDIYADFLEAVKLPEEATMASEIQAKIHAYYKQNVP